MSKPAIQALLHFFERLEEENAPADELETLLIRVETELPPGPEREEILRLAHLDPAKIHQALNNGPLPDEEAPHHGPLAHNQPDTPRHAKPSSKSVDPLIAQYEEVIQILRKALA